MDLDEYRQFKDLYVCMRKGDKTEVIRQYEKMSPEPPSSMTFCEDTVLHMAINMRRESIASEILKNTDPGTLSWKNVFGDTVLHEAASTNMTKLVQELLEKEPLLLSMPNQYNEMPLFKAAQFGNTEMFNLLADKVENIEGPEKAKNHLSRNDKTTILHMTILAEFFDLAYMIAKRYPDLVAAKDEKGLIALQLLSSNPSAFKSGSSYGLLKSFINYCVPDEDAERKDSSHEEEKYKVTRKMNQSLWSLFRKGWPMMENIWKEKRKHESASRLAKLLIAEDTSWEHISTEEDKGKIRVANPAAKELEEGACVTTAQAPVISKADNLDGEDGSTSTPTSSAQAPGISKASNLDGGDGSTPIPILLAQALGISKASNLDGGDSSASAPTASAQAPGISKASNLDGGDSWASAPTSSAKAPDKPKANSLDGEAETSLLLATSNGIVEIVKEILDVYPQAVEHVSHKGENILHMAIKSRQKEILDMVSKMEIPMTRLVRRFDNKGYTLLHHVAVMKYSNGGILPGPALQLQEELHWFDRVRKIIPPHYEMHRSSTEDETAQEFFYRTHTELLKEAQEWLKRTSESCSTVAVLIATVAFAAAYTVPGGSNQDTGLPVLLHDPIFLVFTVMDVLSLASSLTSVVMFLSILTSPFQLQDFRHSLPQKLKLGFYFLFFSVAVTMLAFIATIFLIVHL